MSSLLKKAARKLLSKGIRRTFLKRLRENFCQRGYGGIFAYNNADLSLYDNNLYKIIEMFNKLVYTDNNTLYIKDAI